MNGLIYTARLTALAMLPAAVACPALAGPATGPDLAAWLLQNTDLPAAQVVIAGPENVYTMEPLGPRLPTGEVVALMRTEAIDPAWRAAHGFQSWDAHVLFDCNARRMRVMRSASYPEPLRKGRPKVDEPGQAWLSPKRDEPGAQLLAAACDPGFVWPLCATPAAVASAPSESASAVLLAGRIDATQPPLAKAQPAPPPATDGQYGVQIARGPSQDGATRALQKARKTLGSKADNLTATTEETRIGRKRRYTALLSGFATAEDAAEACKTLIEAGQSCLTRAQAVKSTRPLSSS